jgi:hypothetical protein
MAQPGNARTSRFQFTTATICVGPQDQQKLLTPSKHSVGLTKNVKVDANATKIDLTQGITNDIVASVTNNLPITASAEVYEYTARNLAYGIGLEGDGLVTMSAPGILTAAVASGGTSASIAAADATALGLNVGDWGFIQEALDDQVHVFKVSGVSSGTITFTGYPLPTGVSFSTNARLGKFNKIDADPVKANVNQCVRIIGVSLKDKTPIVLHFPKCRITRGFSMAFSSENFGNMPFEFTPLTPLPDDPGYDPELSKRMSVFTL